VVRSRATALVAGGVLAVSVALPAMPAAAAGTPPGNWKRAAASVIPGVVYVQTQLADGSIVAGTGMVLTSDGEVLTNYHLIRGAVLLAVFDLGDKHVHPAHVVGGDAKDDIAVVQIDGAQNLPTVRVAERSAYVGQEVVAVGNGGGQLGRHPGRILATGRTLTAQDPEAGPETIHGLLETDARLTPGDSGGPLVSAEAADLGRVVGMDTAGLFRRHDGRQTPVAGYAIPIAQALEVVARIEDRSTPDGHSA
jgi:S1-C subfamily serine protease